MRTFVISPSRGERLQPEGCSHRKVFKCAHRSKFLAGLAGGAFATPQLKAWFWILPPAPTAFESGTVQKYQENTKSS